MKYSAILIFLFFTSFNLYSQKIIHLPQVRFDNGKSLYESLKSRKSDREFSEKQLAPEIISDLLWAANGINRKETNHKTAPSSRNYQEMEIYLITEEGAYLYNEENHSIELISGKDLRKLAGTQEYVWNAPLNLIYVADLNKMKSKPVSEMLYITLGADAGFISQNVYLYCASAGLNTVVRASLDKEKLSQELKLSKDNLIILGQTVGYPK